MHIKTPLDNALYLSSLWSEHVRTFFDSTQSQESKSEVSLAAFH